MLTDNYRGRGAALDEERGLPRHFGNPGAEYAAAHSAAILIDRSDEGRIVLEGADRLAILHRISTNAVQALKPGEGRASVLATPIGRIIDRVVLYALDAERTLVRVSAGRGPAVAAYLRRNVFFRDRMTVEDHTAELAQFMLYGPQAGDVVEALSPGASVLPLHHTVSVAFAGEPLVVFAVDAPGVPAFGIIIARRVAVMLWETLVAVEGVRPSGLDVAEMLRVEAGLPGPTGELTGDVIPLEVALWPEVSFSKGCYTGQEIIVRMESRGKLAKTLVGVTLSGPAEAGCAWREPEGSRDAGTLTSVVQLPDGRWIGLGFARPEVAEVDRELVLNGGIRATIRLVPGR